MGTGPLYPEAWGLHSLASLDPLASPGPGAVCWPAWPQSLPASSAKDRPVVRAKDSLAWPSGAGFQDSGILNQLLWQVWPAQLSRGTGRPESCQPAAGGCGAARLGWSQASSSSLLGCWSHCHLEGPGVLAGWAELRWPASFVSAAVCRSGAGGIPDSGPAPRARWFCLYYIKYRCRRSNSTRCFSR